jgi:hypothetical protein
MLLTASEEYIFDNIYVESLIFCGGNNEKIDLRRRDFIGILLIFIQAGLDKVLD